MEKFENEFREQRHDFMNHIQVIYGYLQLNKKEDAIKYINKIVDENKNISSIYALDNKELGIIMEQNLKKLFTKGVRVEVDIEIESFSKRKFSSNYNKKMNLVNNIFNKLENNKCKFVYIYIFEDELGESILIANGESCVNELDWMEEWEKLDFDLDDIKIYKYTYQEDYAYRLTFCD